MGLDLNLLPVDGDHSPAVFYAHNILSVQRNQLVRDIAEIAEKHSKDISEPLSCYLATQENGEHGYGNATDDPYGQPLTYVLAKHLKPLAEKVGFSVTSTKKGISLTCTIQDHDWYGPINRAIVAYICMLPDDFKIVLYWH